MVFLMVYAKISVRNVKGLVITVLNVLKAKIETDKCLVNVKKGTMIILELEKIVQNVIIYVKVVVMNLLVHHVERRIIEF